MKRALIIFVRNPQLGKVKTRLAAQIGDEKALLVYGRLLEHTRKVALDSNCTKYVFVTEPLAIDSWKIFREMEQIGESLGERMFHAFQSVFEKGYDQVIIIGSDCPGLTPAHIHHAFESLERYDAVVGPAQDGGYYLLGLNGLYREIFENKAWSTSSVFTDTMNSIDQLKLSCKVMELLTDVDLEEDLPDDWKKDIADLPDFT